VGVGQVLDRLQPATPQVIEAGQVAREPPARVEAQRRAGTGQPGQHGRQGPQPGPAGRRRPLLVAERPLQAAQLHQRRSGEHLHRPPAGPSSRVAGHGQVGTRRTPHQLHRPDPATQQPQVGRVRTGPKPPVAPLQLRLATPPGPSRVADHQRRVQRHHRPAPVVGRQELRDLVVAGRPPLGHHGPARVEHRQPRRPPPTPGQVHPDEPQRVVASTRRRRWRGSLQRTRAGRRGDPGLPRGGARSVRRLRSGCGRRVWLWRGRLRLGRGGRARRRRGGARRRRRRR
jgi:hypothetical protein